MKFEAIRYLERKTGEYKIEKVPGESFLKFLYYNPFGKLALEALVKRKFLSVWYGKKMNTKKSREKILPFIKSLEIPMEEAEKSWDEFTSFNDFFYRKLKKGARTWDMREEVLVSPADGKILAYENIDSFASFFIKGQSFSLEELFQSKEMAEKYAGGSFVIVRLAPVDYHRYHFPTDAWVGVSHRIQGYYYSVSTHAIRRNLRIFLENQREYTILKSKKFGDIAYFEIGATMVGGIHQTYAENSTVSKGEEKGYFEFGGSTCLLLFEKGKVQLDEDLLEHTKKGIETKVYVGEKIGYAKQGGVF
ncbi:phosphatidylserine decarboxylase [Fusobacterium necrophorum]|uniref:Phosphatidylserine decarboxylase proenzyme n=1 Tax=Fusobacterium necrophorum TaxID=859 RepID=A0A4V1QXI6_9FUSO|nr:phosphatidylserine decarboxylase [Fusobacterium necrophorum]RXZ69786.1 phosphatidylserine decarboxylase [Fusobacterium necrophorum]